MTDFSPLKLFKLQHQFSNIVETVTELTNDQMPEFHCYCECLNGRWTRWTAGDCFKRTIIWWQFINEINYCLSKRHCDVIGSNVVTGFYAPELE